jgi:hypothetical protein
VLPFMRKPNGLYEITVGSPVLKLKNLYMQCDQARCKRISHHDAITMIKCYTSKRYIVQMELSSGTQPNGTSSMELSSVTLKTNTGLHSQHRPMSVPKM